MTSSTDRQTTPGRPKGPLIALVIFFGVYPAAVFDVTGASVQALVNNITVALDAAPAAADAAAPAAH